MDWSGYTADHPHDAGSTQNVTLILSLSLSLNQGCMHSSIFRFIRTVLSAMPTTPKLAGLVCANHFLIKFKRIRFGVAPVSLSARCIPMTLLFRMIFTSAVGIRCTCMYNCRGMLVTWHTASHCCFLNHLFLFWTLFCSLCCCTTCTARLNGFSEQRRLLCFLLQRLQLEERQSLLACEGYKQL